MVGELEVAAFTADFRTNQHLGAEFLIGEVGGGAVTLKNVHAFMEHRGRNTGTHAQRVLQVHGGFGVGADHQDLGALEHFQLVDQPFDPWVETPPTVFFVDIRLRLEADFRVQLGVLAQGQFEVFVRVRQRVGVQLALREPLHRGAGVAEQHTAGAVAVQQLTHQTGAGIGSPSLTAVSSASPSLPRKPWMVWCAAGDRRPLSSSSCTASATGR